MFLKESLKYAYRVLDPFSRRFKVDFNRQLFSLKMLDRALGDFRGKKILDIGTGIGIMPLALKKLGAQAVGIDKYIFSGEETPMFQVGDVEALRKIWQHEGVDVRELDFFSSSLPFEAGEFDVVISEAMIEHLKSPRLFLEKIFMLTRGRGGGSNAAHSQNDSSCGLALISSPNLSTFLKRVRFLFGLSPMWDLKEFFDLGEKFQGHWREYTLKELERVCKWVGFEIVAAYNKNMLAPFKLSKWPRSIARALSVFLSGSRDMNFVLCRKT